MEGGSGGSGAITKELMRKRMLILAVLRREIERLSIWRNPKNLLELRISGEDIVQVSLVFPDVIQK